MKYTRINPDDISIILTFPLYEKNLIRSDPDPVFLRVGFFFFLKVGSRCGSTPLGSATQVLYGPKSNIFMYDH